MYTSVDVRREADEYREWARERDREQFNEVVAAKLIALNEAKHHEMMVRECTIERA